MTKGGLARLMFLIMLIGMAIYLALIAMAIGMLFGHPARG